MNERSDEHAIAERLTALVRSALAKERSFEGLAIRRDQRVIVVNSHVDEEPAWVEQSLFVLGPDVSVMFVFRPLGPRQYGRGMMAARGCGTLDFQYFECGCTAAQIPGEDDWQLIRTQYCRFGAEQHRLGSWPIDSLKRPDK